MAVYKRTYSTYNGPRTPDWSRFLILPRAGFRRIMQSRWMNMYLIACFFYPLGLTAYVYIANNLTFLESFGVQAGNFLEVTPSVFEYFCIVQGAFAYVLTAFIGPSAVSPDLVNNAMPLYLCRPFSRTEYVLGKLSLLLMLLSMITWMPGLVVFTIQCSLAGWDWTVDNLWIGGSVFVGLSIWILVLSLIALAMSAWVKWRIAAGGLLLGIFFFGAGFGTAVNEILDTEYGTLINLPMVMDVIWTWLFDQYDETTAVVTVGMAVACLTVVCLGCLGLLWRKVRAFEVVK